MALIPRLLLPCLLLAGLPRSPAVRSSPDPDLATASDTIPLAVVARAEAAFWAHDTETLMSHYAPGAEGYVLAHGDSAATKPIGAERMRAGYAQFFERYPRHRSRLVGSIENGPYIVRQYADEAGVPHPGRSVWLFEVRGGKIRRYWRSPPGALTRGAEAAGR